MDIIENPGAIVRTLFKDNDALKLVFRFITHILDFLSIAQTSVTFRNQAREVFKTRKDLKKFSFMKASDYEFPTETVESLLEELGDLISHFHISRVYFH